MKKIVIDLDGTLTVDTDVPYKDKPVNMSVLNKLKEYKSSGYSITIFTARNMRTYKGNIGEINIYTLPIIIEWLEKHRVPFDEVIVGKPWCGNDGFYVDDKAIRPSEFASLTPRDIDDILSKENTSINSGQ